MGTGSTGAQPLTTALPLEVPVWANVTYMSINTLVFSNSYLAHQNTLKPAIVKSTGYKSPHSHPRILMRCRSY